MMKSWMSGAALAGLALTLVSSKAGAQFQAPAPSEAGAFDSTSGLDAAGVLAQGQFERMRARRQAEITHKIEELKGRRDQAADRIERQAFDEAIKVFQSESRAADRQHAEAIQGLVEQTDRARGVRRPSFDLEAEKVKAEAQRQAVAARIVAELRQALDPEAVPQRSPLDRQFAQARRVVHTQGPVPADPTATTQADLALAESDLKHAEDRVAWSDAMRAKGFIAEAQNHAEHLVADRARFIVEQARRQRDRIDGQVPLGPAGAELGRARRAVREGAEHLERLRGEITAAERSMAEARDRLAGLEGRPNPSVDPAALEPARRIDALEQALRRTLGEIEALKQAPANP